MGFQPLVTASLSPDPHFPKRVRGSRLPALKSRNGSAQPAAGLTDRSGLAFWAKWEGRNVCGQPLPGRSHLCPAVWGLEIRDTTEGKGQGPEVVPNFGSLLHAHLYH